MTQNRYSIHLLLARPVAPQDGTFSSIHHVGFLMCNCAVPGNSKASAGGQNRYSRTSCLWPDLWHRTNVQGTCKLAFLEMWLCRTREQQCVPKSTARYSRTSYLWLKRQSVAPRKSTRPGLSCTHFLRQARPCLATSCQIHPSLVFLLVAAHAWLLMS